MKYQWAGSWADTLAAQKQPEARAYVLADRCMQASSKQIAMAWLEMAHTELGLELHLDRYTLAAIRESAEDLQARINDEVAFR